MSLINKMLQDLDARGGAGAGQGGPQQVRSVPSGPRQPRVLMAAGAGAAVLLLAAGGWLGWRHLQRGADTPAPAAQVPGAPPSASIAGNAANADNAANAGNAAGADAHGKPDHVGDQLSEARRQADLARVEAERLATIPAPAPAPVPAPPARVSGLAPVPVPAPVASARKTGMAAAAVHTEQEGAGGGAPAKPASAAQARAARLADGKADAAHADPARQQAGSGITVNSLQQGENSYRRGLASLQDGRVQEAVAHLEQAVFYYPRHDAARQTLVGLLIENKRLDEATRHLQFGLGLDPKQVQMAMLLARLQLEKGGPAIETLQRSLPYAGNNGDYLAFLAGALQRAQRNREAAEQYRAALRLQPQNGVWWMGLGIALQADKRNAEALDAFTHAKNAGNLSQELQSFVERKLQQLR